MKEQAGEGDITVTAAAGDVKVSANELFTMKVRVEDVMLLE